MKLGFIGLGRMGAAMASNLVKAGHEVTVFNRSREKHGHSSDREHARLMTVPAPALATP